DGQHVTMLTRGKDLRFVEEQGWTVLLDKAEEDCGRRVQLEQGVPRRRLEERQHLALPALALARKGEARKGEEQRKEVRGHRPHTDDRAQFRSWKIHHCVEGPIHLMKNLCEVRSYVATREQNDVGLRPASREIGVGQRLGREHSVESGGRIHPPR